jgi:hypothetical protein
MPSDFSWSDYGSDPRFKNLESNPFGTNNKKKAYIVHMISCVIYLFQSKQELPL